MATPTAVAKKMNRFLEGMADQTGTLAGEIRAIRDDLAAIKRHLKIEDEPAAQKGRGKGKDAGEEGDGGSESEVPPAENLFSSPPKGEGEGARLPTPKDVARVITKDHGRQQHHR